MDLEMAQDVNETEHSTSDMNRGTDMFTTRRHDVFAGLGELEEKHSAFLKAASKDGTMEIKGLTKQDPEEDSEKKFISPQRQNATIKSRLGGSRNSDYQHGRPISRHQRHHIKSKMDSDGFRKPHNTPSYRRHQRSCPDFKKNPDKYTFYSLGDVTAQEMSERSNAQAAFAFLEERRRLKKREKEEATGTVEEVKFDTASAACSQGLIAFSRPIKKNSSKDEEVNERPMKDSLKDLSSDFYTAHDDDTNSDKISQTVENNTNVHGCNSSGFKSRKRGNNKRNIRKHHDADDDSD